MHEIHPQKPYGGGTGRDENFKGEMGTGESLHGQR